jgi:hypothetical protein
LLAADIDEVQTSDTAEPFQGRVLYAFEVRRKHSSIAVAVTRTAVWVVSVSMDSSRR